MLNPGKKQALRMHLQGISVQDVKQSPVLLQDIPHIQAAVLMWQNIKLCLYMHLPCLPVYIRKSYWVLMHICQVSRHYNNPDYWAAQRTSF